MKQHEKDAQIAVLRKQIEKLEAIPVEPEQPLCVIPGRMARGEKYVYQSTGGESFPTTDTQDLADGGLFSFGNYFSSHRQASADAHAVSVMRRMRRMPGVVGADAVGTKYMVHVIADFVRVENYHLPFLSACMFPCYSTEAQARAAIEAVGGEDALRRCAEYWSGAMK
ncbi:MAG TPA: hypothetical protein VFM34_11955 [Moraxellaceae bacterium]|nr:hypothetical protein [Moraxellaceae bacterium]